MFLSAGWLVIRHGTNPERLVETKSSAGRFIKISRALCTCHGIQETRFRRAYACAYNQQLPHRCVRITLKNHPYEYFLRSIIQFNYYAASRWGEKVVVYGRLSRSLSPRVDTAKQAKSSEQDSAVRHRPLASQTACVTALSTVVRSRTTTRVQTPKAAWAAIYDLLLPMRTRQSDDGSTGSIYFSTLFWDYWVGLFLRTRSDH